MSMLQDYIQRLKYKEQMMALEIKAGAGWNTEVFEINNKEAFRFIWDTDVKQNNHKPVYIQRPKRALKGDRREIAGYGLSCLDALEAAEDFYKFLERVHKNLKESVGDSIAQGILNSFDGVIDEADRHKHFNLFEFENCDLSVKFTVIKRIV